MRTGVAGVAKGAGRVDTHRMEIAKSEPFHEAALDLMRKVLAAREQAIAACRMLGFKPAEIVHLANSACRIEDDRGELARVWCEFADATITVRTEYAPCVAEARARALSALLPNELGPVPIDR